GRANGSLIRQSLASGARGAVIFAVSTGGHCRSGPRPPEGAADGPIAEFLVDPEHRCIRLVVLCEHEFDATFGSVHEGRALRQQGEATAAILTQRPGHLGDCAAAWGDAEVREGDRSVV